MIYDNMLGLNAHTNKGVSIMKPRGPLMIEHRLIEKMLEVVRNKISLIDRYKLHRPCFY